MQMFKTSNRFCTVNAVTFDLLEIIYNIFRKSYAGAQYGNSENNEISERRLENATEVCIVKVRLPLDPWRGC